MKSHVKRQAKKATGSIFKYETNKMVQINSKKIGLLFMFIQILIIAYIIGFVMIYSNGYQDSYGLTSSVVTKAKGISKARTSEIGRKMWDITDMVIPPQERDALFITTNAIITPNQTQRACPEAYDVPGALCTSKSDCPKNDELILGNGYMTGECVDTVLQKKTCEVYAWCPLENDTIAKGIESFKKILDFTILIKNTIIFDSVNIRRSNLFMWESQAIPKNCTFEANNNLLKYCPIFTVSSIVGNLSKLQAEDLFTYGGIFQVIITWNCNLDRSLSDCRPEYSFNRLDSTKAKMSKGWNFRYANYYVEDKIEYRMLYKVFGLRILIGVRGQARRFSVTTLTMNLGSGIALLSAATVICNIIILYIMPNRKKYAETIYELHNDDDAYQDLEEEEESKEKLNLVTK